MDEHSRQKPLPARPVPVAPPAAATHGAVTPSNREGPATPPPPSTVGADLDEAVVEAAGATWRVRVLGRSGRAAARSAPLLLLGFWNGEPSGPPSLEAPVAARTLAELSAEALESALARASPPPTDERKRPFFEEADHGHR